MQNPPHKFIQQSKELVEEKCEICGKRVMFLENHLNSCHPMCEICNARFDSKSEFDIHYRTVHLCDICEKEFISMEARDFHKNSHPICKICGMQIKTSSE